MKSVLNVVNVYFAVPFFFGNQFKYFQKKGFKMHLICSPSKHLGGYAEEQGIQYSPILINRNITPWQDLLALIKICKYIKTNKIDIVAGHNAKGSLLAILSAKIMGVKKIILFRHGSLYNTKKGIARKLFLLEDRFVAFCADIVINVSPSLGELCIKDKLNPASKQVLLGKGTCGGIDALTKFNPEFVNEQVVDNLRNDFKINKTDFVIGYSGRLVKDKGIEELVGGFILIKNKYPEKKFKLLLVGPFEHRDSLSFGVKETIDNDKDIITTGYVGENMENYYSLMTMFILPSYREGFGMAVLEASAMLLPVLTTRSIGCVDSIIEGVTGEYVEISTEGIFNGIRNFFDLNLREKLGLNGREMVLKYYENKVLWPEIEKIYNKK